MIRGQNIVRMSIDELFDLQNEIEHELSGEKDADTISIYESDLEKVSGRINELIALESEEMNSESAFIQSF